MAIIMIICAVGFLASLFDWEWYFRLSRKARFWDDLMGRKAYRIFNAVISVIIFLTAVSMAASGTMR
ncbi:MAG: immunity 17 family protein [Oscillospiraceae bacterium]|nr:immunity 17 family protein [Oscillospiraceae bacterium]